MTQCKTNWSVFLMVLYDLLFYGEGYPSSRASKTFRLSFDKNNILCNPFMVSCDNFVKTMLCEPPLNRVASCGKNAALSCRALEF